jgi:GMP synthase (glutamine-hydrolysing)
MLRVALIDLLAERSTFGHEGNLQMLSPLSKHGEVEVWLLTPQMQDGAVGGEMPQVLGLEDVPFWHGDCDFASLVSLNPLKEGDGTIHLQRMAMPASEDISEWLLQADLGALYCTGSRRNVSQWEDWMEPSAELLRCAIDSDVPTLGVCFGHQLLCKAMGGEIERAESSSDLVCELEKTELGGVDPLFAGIDNLRGLFTHQDHVVSVGEDCITLAHSQHAPIAAVRIRREKHMLDAYGVQFHPEAYPEMIQRSLEAGFLSLEESNSVEGEHDGVKVLENFASVVLSRIG